MVRTRHQRKTLARLIEKFGINNIFRAIDGPSGFRKRLVEVLMKDPYSKPQKQILPLKHIRLQELLDAGINCPPFLYWLRGEIKIGELKDFWKKHGRISLRTVTEEINLQPTPKLPVAYDKSDWGFITGFCIEHNIKYHTLVNAALPLEDSLLAGNIILLDPDHYIVSYFEGYGTPRDVDDKDFSELKVYLRSFGNLVPAWAPPQIDEIIGKLKEFKPDFRPITFEFSIYPYPVGVLKRHEVFWEWRSGCAHDLYTIVTRMLERVDSHELTLRIPRQVVNV